MVVVMNLCMVVVMDQKAGWLWNWLRSPILCVHIQYTVATWNLLACIILIPLRQRYRNRYPCRCVRSPHHITWHEGGRSIMWYDAFPPRCNAHHSHVYMHIDADIFRFSITLLEYRTCYYKRLHIHTYIHIPTGWSVPPLATHLHRLLASYHSPVGTPSVA